jgi:hypothetical protein
VFWLVGGGAAGVGQEAGDGVGGGVGDGGADGDLLVFFAVDGLDVEVFEEPFGQAGGGAGEDVTQDRQSIEQGRVGDFGGGGVELVALGFERGRSVWSSVQRARLRGERQRFQGGQR